MSIDGVDLLQVVLSQYIPKIGKEDSPMTVYSFYNKWETQVLVNTFWVLLSKVVFLFSHPLNDLIPPPKMSFAHFI